MDLKRVLSFPPYPGDYLHPVVYACTAVMLLCLFASIITYVVHHSVIRINRKGWHILLNFLFHTSVTFGVFAGGINQIKDPVVCQVVGVVLHYSSLCAMLWLAFTARGICKEVSKAAPCKQGKDPPSKQHPKASIFRFYLVSDGVPLIIVGVTAAFSLENYGSQVDAPYCWMAWEASLGGFYGPTAFLVLVMCVYFLCTFVLLKRHPERKYELRAMTEEQQRLATAEIGHCHPGESGDSGEMVHVGCPAITASILANEHSFKAQLRATAFTLFLFLATWAFGALAVSQGHFLDMIFSCLYGAFSVTLGLFLLIQHCAKRDDVWHRWWACCPSRPKVEVNGDVAGNARVPALTTPHLQTPIHCHGESPCLPKPLLSPHPQTPSTHCKMGSLPAIQNHSGTCCATLHSPSPILGDSPRPQSLPDELPRPALPLQSCLKDRTKSRSFNRPRPCLRDYAYHMASTSMDGSIHSSHLDSPRSSVHLDNPLPFHASHLDSPLACHSPHPDNQLRCPSPRLEGLLPSHSLQDSLSCLSSHLDSHLTCHEGHTCHRHLVCCPKADPFLSPCQPEDTDTEPLLYSGPAKGADKQQEEIMLHLDFAPPKSVLSCPQATLSRKGTLSRRGTLSRNGSIQEDYMFSSDATGNIRTGPWKNETTV